MNKNKKPNVLNYLFFCIVINMIPTIMLKIFSVSNGIYTMLNGFVYIIEIIIMIYAIRNSIKMISNKKIMWLLLFLLMQISTQIVNYFNQGNIEFQDIIHIVSVIINVFVFILCMPYSKIEKEDIYKFMKKMVFLGVIACIYNVIVNGTSILHIASMTSSYAVKLSSFFPNRNQFGIFMIIVLLSNLYVKQSNKKLRYKLSEIFFIFNLILTMSRNSIIGMICIYIIKFYLDCFTTKKISKNKALIVTLFIIAVCIFIGIILSNETYMNLINKLFIRSDSLESGSGRFAVWKNGINIVLDNNVLLGVGRFNGIKLNKELYNSDLEYFHSLYVETFVIYGIVGLVMIYLLFKYIIASIIKSSLDREYKNILLTATLTFLIISIFETTTRFSIGYADMMALMYFISIPLMCLSIKYN